jgi:hypothetical protein
MMLPPSGPHVLHCLFRREEKAEDVDVEMLVKMLFGHPFERRELVSPGVVDEDIDSAERPLRVRKEALDVRGLRDIGLHGDRFAPTRGNLPDDALGVRLAQRIVHDDRSAFFRQRLRDTRPDALGRAGHDGDLSFELLAHVLTPYGQTRHQVLSGRVTPRRLKHPTGTPDDRTLPVIRLVLRTAAQRVRIQER